MTDVTATPEPLIVALGASNTAGYGVGMTNAYPAVIERLLHERGMPARIHNAGISGNTTGEMLARLNSVIPIGTRIVLFQPGSNDARIGISEAERERNIETITTRLQRRGIAVIRVAAACEAARSANLQPDGIHYTATGHEEIAARLVDEVEAALDRQGVATRLIRSQAVTPRHQSGKASRACRRA